MQVSRLFQILYFLMERGTVTAKELAEHLEVSVRTVYRDIEALSQAGVPVYALQGRKGGISIAQGFVLEKSFLTVEEQRDVLASLQGASALGAYGDRDQALKKLSSFFGSREPEWLKIDLSDWSNRHQQDYELVKEGILRRRVLCFDYYGANGQMTARRAEPLRLWYKSGAWYLVAFCRERGEMRTFKMSRIKRPQLTQETFVPREPEEPRQLPGYTLVSFTMWIDASQAYRVYDSFEEEEITLQEDGSFLVRVAYPVDDWFYGSILSYGVHAKVIDPPELRERIEEMLKKMLENYQREKET